MQILSKIYLYQIFTHTSITSHICKTRIPHILYPRIYLYQSHVYKTHILYIVYPLIYLYQTFTYIYISPHVYQHGKKKKKKFKEDNEESQ